MKRNIWYPKMTVGRLERLLQKPALTDNDKEDLLDFKYLLLFEPDMAVEKGLMYQFHLSDCGAGCQPLKLWWIPNIESRTKGFQSQYNL